MGITVSAFMGGLGVPRSSYDRPSSRHGNKSGQRCPKCGREMETRIVFLECPGCGHTIKLGTASATRRDRSEPVVMLHDRLRESLEEAGAAAAAAEAREQAWRWQQAARIRAEKLLLCFVPMLWMYYYNQLVACLTYRPVLNVLNPPSDMRVGALMAIYLAAVGVHIAGLALPQQWAKRTAQLLIGIVGILHLSLLVAPGMYIGLFDYLKLDAGYYIERTLLMLCIVVWYIYLLNREIAYQQRIQGGSYERQAVPEV